jgi:inosose dehydratase
VRVANAPCSWGEVDETFATVSGVGYSRMLDELAQAGYAGTELGDWGFLPTDAATLRAELQRRDLALVGAFVPVTLADRAAHEAGEQQGVRVAALLRESHDARDGAPWLVLSDDATPARMAVAGRAGVEHELSAAGWRTLAQGAERIARAVRDATGLRTAFHQHCGTNVETPAEVERLLDLTDPALVGLCFDTGHYTYGGGDAVDGLRRFGDRVWHVHIKDCDAAALTRARGNDHGYLEAVRDGVFSELGAGVVDVAGVLAQLRARAYAGWLVVEDEAPPSCGTPLERALRDREQLRALGV